MKLKHLQVLKEQHKRYLVKITTPKISEPDSTCHITHALVRGENVPLRSVSEISNSARDVVASCEGYSRSRTMKFEDIFKTPASYAKALREFNEAKESSRKASEKYQKEAEALLLKAELNDSSEADEVSSDLRLVAIKHGIDA